MIACGTYIARRKRRRCLHCNDFMLWGVSTGYCDRTKEDMSCGDTCKKWNRYNPNRWEPYKVLYRHDIRYEIWKTFRGKTMYFSISKIHMDDMIDTDKICYNPRQAIRLIEEDAKRYEER